MLVALAAVAGAPLHSAAPSASAANGLKAVVIVGPAGDSTSLFLEIGDRLADQAAAVGFDVRRVFHPRATAERVLQHLPGANLVVYLGHGNGWPSPYAPFQEKTKNGFGLNDYEGAPQNKHVYRGANWIRNNIPLAPNAVALLVGACYASGNGEPGMPIPTQDVARQRVDNFASGFLGAGARAVFAFGWEQRANYPELLATSNKTMDEIFMTRSSGAPTGWVGWNDKYFDSQRTAGAKVHLDPHPNHGYYRGLTGDMSMTATEFRGGQSGDAGSSEPGLPIADTSAPSVPTGLSAEATGGRNVTLTWDAASDDSGDAVRYRLYRNGTRIRAGLTGTSYVDTTPSNGTFSYQVQSVDAAGNRSAKSAAVSVEVGGGGGSTASTSGPAAPQGLAAQSLGRRYVGLSWEASDSSLPIRKYVVFRNGRVVGRTTSLSFTDRPRRVGTFQYQVRAVDNDGNRSALTPAVSGSAVKTVE